MFRTLRPGPFGALGAVLVACVIGCTGSRDGDRSSTFRRLTGQADRSEAELRASVGWIDPEAQDAGVTTISREEVLAFAARSRAAAKPAAPFPKRSILIVSGGGSYGAYPAGVLAGWTATGTRPEFDVVTGISTGALVGAYAFLGPEFDCEMQYYYTQMRNEDIYRRRRFIAGLFSESLADNAPLKKLIDKATTDERIARFAVEHQKGRRFYVGTTDLDARRAIVWDMGAIASRGTPESRELFRQIILASAAIPGFFPPVRIPVTVDNRRYIERHIDGGTTSSMFFAPPWVPPGARENLPPGWLHGSDMYMLVAGKMYPDPVPVRPRAIAIASNAISTIVYDQTRSDLHKLFLLSAMTGMNYYVSVTPRDVPVPESSTEFDPREMTQLFEAGHAWALGGPPWRITPPGYEPGEGAKYRASRQLTDVGQPPPEQ